MKIRIKFTKTDMMRFIGHLDLLRYFQKAIMRSGVAPIYTKGFSPHMILSFASPLSVGLESTGEYCDLEIAYKDPYATEVDAGCLRDLETEEDKLPKTPSGDELRASLNAAMTDGIRILSVRRIGETHSDNAMALVQAADYQIRLLDGFLSAVPLAEKWKEFVSQPSINFEKKVKPKNKNRKRHEAEVKSRMIDLRPMVIESGVIGSSISLRCSCGSTANLKPELLMEAFCDYTDYPYDRFGFRIRRIEMYDEAGRTLEELGQIL